MVTINTGRQQYCDHSMVAAYRWHSLKILFQIVSFHCEFRTLVTNLASAFPKILILNTEVSTPKNANIVGNKPWQKGQCLLWTRKIRLIGFFGEAVTRSGTIGEINVVEIYCLKVGFVFILSTNASN